MPSIFLSHNSKDKFFVRKLAERLTEHGVKVWLDEAEIKIGESLTQKIGKALQENDFVGVVLSTNSIKSEWVQRELQVAIQREFEQKKVIVLPLLLEPVDLPPFLGDKLYADFTSPDKFEETFTKLLRALGVSHDDIKKEKIKKPKVEPIKRVIQSPAEKKLATFEDIKIIDLDEERSFKPDPEKLLYKMYLKLSNMPPFEWEKIFEAERRFPRHTMWRRAWIEGQYIVIHCVPDEIEKYHLRDLKQDVDNSNKKYREYLKELAHNEISEQQKEQEEAFKIKNLKNRLGFD